MNSISFLLAMIGRGAQVVDAGVSFSQYKREINSFELLNREDEQFLGNVKGNDLYNLGSSALNLLVLHNLRLSVWIAKRYTHKGLLLEDLVGYANFGLIKAARRFDPESGFRFSTYAIWWIRQAVTKAIVDYGRTVRLPVHMHTITNKVRKAINQFKQCNNGAEPSDEELLDALEISEENLKLAKSSMARIASLDDVLPGTDDYTLEDTIADESPPPDETATDSVLANWVRDLVYQLDEPFSNTLVYRFGLDGKYPKTLEEIGEIEGVTRERVRQWEERAFVLLGTKMKWDRFCKYFGLNYGGPDLETIQNLRSEMIMKKLAERQLRETQYGENIYRVGVHFDTNQPIYVRRNGGKIDKRTREISTDLQFNLKELETVPKLLG